MLILQLPPRIAKFREPPSFPNLLELSVELEPRSLFGEGKLNDRLAIYPVGGKMHAEADEYHGGIRFRCQGQLGKLSLVAQLFGGEVSIAGRVATLRVSEVTERTFEEALGLAEVHLPAFLSAVVNAPVEAIAAYGTVGTAFFQVQFVGTIESAFFAETPEKLAQRIATHFARLSALPDGSQRVYSAHRYLQQARRLRLVSSYPGEFLGERLLNLYKVLEALFASRQVDAIRKALEAMGMERDVAEFFCSIVYVRDQLDGGHMALTPLDPGDYEVVHRFAERAEDGVTWLLFEAIAAIQKGSLAIKAPGGKADRSKLMAALRSRDDLVFRPHENPPIRRLR